MPVSLTHTTAATGTDSGDGKISKNAWNELHTLTLTGPAVLGRAATGAGAAVELPIGQAAGNILDKAAGDALYAPKGAGDPWSYVKLAANEVTTSTGNIVTALAFTPLANRQYVVEGMLFLQAAATTTGARPGIQWPTGTLQEIAWVLAPTSLTAFVSRFWGAPTTANAASTAVAVANEGLYGKVEASFVTGASPSGQFIITISSEVAGSEARIMANSFIRYREI